MTFDSEKSLIGALLIDPKAVKDCGNLRPDMFCDRLLGRVYQEFLRAYDFGYPANLVTLRENLSDVPQGSLLDLVRECSSASVTSVAAGKYAEAIVRSYKARSAAGIVSAANFLPSGIDQQIGQVINELEALRDGGRAAARNLGQIVDDVSGRYFTASDRPRLYTGFPKLDNCMGGLEGGDVIVIGARPAVGKSAFVTQILSQMAQDGKRVLLYNLEMLEAQVYERVLARLSGISLTRIRRGKAFLGDEKERFSAANEKLRKLDIWISSGAKSVSEIRSECRHMGADCIVIDYLQLVRTDRRYSNRASEVGDVSKSIKALAMELNRPIIVLSQLNRASEGRQRPEPTMAELRESGDIEQDASVVILLWNQNEKDSSQKGLKVEKNRQGQQLRMGLAFDGGSMDFRETDLAETDFKPCNQKTPFD